MRNVSFYFQLFSSKFIILSPPLNLASVFSMSLEKTESLSFLRIYDDSSLSSDDSNRSFLVLGVLILISIRLDILLQQLENLSVFQNFFTYGSLFIF